MLLAFIALGIAMFVAGAFILRQIRARAAQDRETLQRDPATRNAAASVAGLADQSDSILRIVGFFALGTGALMIVVSSLALAVALLD